MPRETQIGSDIRTKSGFRSVAEAIARLAERQHGAISRAQLLALGLTASAITRWISAGRLHVIHKGVYAFGRRRLTEFGEWTAAVLAGGERAALSHISAARLWRITTISERRQIHVTAVGSRKRRGIRFHECALDAKEVTTRHGIPVTTPLRTLIDFAAVANQGQVDKAVREALYQHLVTTTSLTSCCSTLGNRRGSRKLRKAIKATKTTGRTRSELEEAFLAFLDHHKLPPPDATNALMQLGDLQIEADFLWRDARLIIELDTQQTHDNPHSFEADRLRDRRLQAAGWRTVRITDDQIHYGPTTTAEDLDLLIAAVPTEP